MVNTARWGTGREEGEGRRGGGREGREEEGDGTSNKQGERSSADAQAGMWAEAAGEFCACEWTSGKLGKEARMVSQARKTAELGRRKSCKSLLFDMCERLLDGLC